MDPQTDVDDLLSWYKLVKYESSWINIEKFCCLSPKITAMLIAFIGLVSCRIDFFLERPAAATECLFSVEHVVSFKRTLLNVFQLANLLLLLAICMESSRLVQVYVWCTMSYVMLGLAVALLDLLLCVKQEGALAACRAIVPQVAWLFVLFGCLPLVEKYRRDIEDTPISC